MKLKRFLLTGFATAFVFAACAVSASACTEIYVGKDVSEDGSIIIARSNDYQKIWPNYITIVERVENEPGRELPISADGKVTVPVKATTLKYQATPWMDYTTAENGAARDACCGCNEMGVAFTMSVTAFPNEKAKAADPFVEGGLAEQAATDLVLSQAETAREAIELLTEIIDEYGAVEGAIATAADSDEVWYLEIYTGHQYAAVKLPSDKVAVFGNEYTLEYVSDYEASIASPELESLAEKKGFAVTDEEKGLNLYKSYSGDSVAKDYSRLRTWIGHKTLAPSQYEDYSLEELYPLTFEPDEKVSFEDVTELIRNRFEGTEYSPDETGVSNMRVIGTDTAMSVHILQIFPELPKEMSVVLWECTGPAVYGVFVPVSNASAEIAEPYANNQGAEEAGEYNFDTSLYPWYVIKELNTIGMRNYKVYGEPVRKCFSRAENTMYSELTALLKETAEEFADDPEAAAEEITAYCCAVQNQAFEDACRMLSKLRWTQSYNSNTMKSGVNPETGESNITAEELTPVELEIDTGLYKRRVLENC